MGKEGTRSARALSSARDREAAMTTAYEFLRASLDDSAVGSAYAGGRAGGGEIDA